MNANYNIKKLMQVIKSVKFVYSTNFSYRSAKVREKTIVSGKKYYLCNLLPTSEGCC